MQAVSVQVVVPGILPATRMKKLQKQALLRTLPCRKGRRPNVFTTPSQGGEGSLPSKGASRILNHSGRLRSKKNAWAVLQPRQGVV
jgi:hypothetical protein